MGITTFGGFFISVSKYISSKLLTGSCFLIQIQNFYQQYIFDF
ncbi:hypothetical protein AM2_1616 [Lactococcus cremoris]|nr:hypothetical protein SK110_0879 [Lactococcus cremoris]KZK53332.1 hypothetical protein AM2_1616 [Lactococcus cremoris]